MTELESDSPVTQVNITCGCCHHCSWSIFHHSVPFYWLDYRCCSVIMTACNFQPIHLWRGMWNFWLNVWMICQSSNRRFVSSVEVFMCMLWFILSLISVLWFVVAHHKSIFFVQFQFYYRSLTRQQAQQQAWLQKRR